MAYQDQGVLGGNGGLDNKYEKDHVHRPSYSGSAGAAEGNADELLGVLGYQPELVRSRSTFQVAFMSFVLASVPYGLATTLLYPIAGGGPVAVVWGWCGVCAIIGCLAVSLGEITSVYPTAGGVYYQTFMLAPPKNRRILAWICGWAYSLGNVIITLSVNFGTTLFFVGCINIFQDSAGDGIWTPADYQYYLVFFAITIVCNLVSALGNKWLPILDVSQLYYLFMDYQS
jgi:amino acid transporter